MVALTRSQWDSVVNKLYMDSWFIKIHRKILDWEWYDDINTTRLFTHLLFTVNWEDKKWHGIEIKRGEKLTSRDKLASESGLTPQQVRTALDKLKSTNEVTSKTTNKYTIVRLTNYELYQWKVTSKPPDEQQTDNKRITTTKELKELKEYNNTVSEFQKIADKESKDVYPYFLYSFLKLWWIPWKSDTMDNMKEWMRYILQNWWVTTANDAIQVMKEFTWYWDTRRDEKWFEKKNWKTTLLNSISLPANKTKYESRKK